MIEHRIPVFDVGDTLLPSKKMINETVRDKLEQKGYKDIPEVNIYRYNIYKSSNIQEFLDDNEFDADAEEITQEYLNRVESYVIENNVLEVLKRCSDEFGAIGFITDNTIEMREFWSELLERNGVEYLGFVISEEVGEKKPRKKIFERFIEERDMSAEEFVYIGNNPKVDKGAERIGMKFVWLDKFDTFKSEFDGETIHELDFESIERVVRRKPGNNRSEGAELENEHSS